MRLPVELHDFLSASIHKKSFTEQELESFDENATYEEITNCINLKTQINDKYKYIRTMEHLCNVAPMHQLTKLIKTVHGRVNKNTKPRMFAKSSRNKRNLF